jgi:ataxia telangiectasia mutated family protein
MLADASATDTHLTYLISAASLQVARETNHLPEAASAIMRAWTLCKGDSHELWALNEQVCSFAEARLAWSRGETDSAIQLAKSAANVVSMQLVETSGEKHASAKELLVDILCTTGEWTSKTRSESSQDILDDFLRRAVQDAAHLSQARKCAAHFQLASYVAGLHMRVRDRVQSAEWKLGRRVVESRQNELMQCEKAAREIRGDQRQKQMFQRHAVTLRREVSLDIEERQAVEMTVQTFLLEALSQYEEGLKASTGPDLHHVFQVASLWFANQEDTAVLKAAERIVRSVPSYKFVPLAYQISSRISLANHSAVTSLIQRLCREHPHHILPKLIALANGEKVSASSRGSAAYKQNLTQSQDRIRAAKRLLQELQQTENAVGALVTSLQQLSDGYIAIASADTRSFQDKKMKEIQIMSISRDGAALLEKCGERAAIVRGGAGQPAPMITRPPPIDPSCNYGDVLSVISFAPTLRLADSGIHCPMILHCKGSDGITYQQLVKGEDDLRQDAIMQQVSERHRPLIILQMI